MATFAEPVLADRDYPLPVGFHAVGGPVKGYDASKREFVVTVEDYLVPRKGKAGRGIVEETGPLVGKELRVRVQREDMRDDSIRPNYKPMERIKWDPARLVDGRYILVFYKARKPDQPISAEYLVIYR